jgi:protein-L-isoaspartate(D-aspartate) O-methyltransferase
VTHPLDAWLDALSDGGRLVVPLTATMGALGPIRKGPVVRLSMKADGFAARLVTFVAIYSAIGLRAEELNTKLGEALRRMPLPKLTRFRREAHERTDACWLHTDRYCLS